MRRKKPLNAVGTLRRPDGVEVPIRNRTTLDAIETRDTVILAQRRELERLASALSAARVALGELELSALVRAARALRLLPREVSAAGRDALALVLRTRAESARPDDETLPGDGRTYPAPEPEKVVAA